MTDMADITTPLIPPRVSRWAWALVPLSTALVLAGYWTRTYRQRIDFNIYYEAVRFGRTHSIYDYYNAEFPKLGFTYPPFAALVIRPLTLLDQPIAEHLWLILGLALSAVFLCIIVPRLDWPPSWRPIGVPLSIAAGMWTIPVTLTASIGQINAIIAVAIAVDAVLLKRRARWTGLGIGFAAAMKLTPGILIPFLILAGRRREAAIATGSFGAFTLLGVIVHPQDSWRFWSKELWATDRVGPFGSALNNSVRRIVTFTHFSDRVQMMMWLALVLVIVAIGTRRALAAYRHGQIMMAITLMMLVSYIVSPITWAHHLYFLIPAAIAWLITAPRLIAIITAVPLAWPLIDPMRSAMGPPRLISMVLLLLLLPTGRRHPEPNDPDPGNDDAPEQRHDQVGLDASMSSR